MTLPARKSPAGLLSLADIDPGDEREMKAWYEQQDVLAGERVRAAVADLQARGILDAQGRRINKELPPDMRDDSNTA